MKTKQDDRIFADIAFKVSQCKDFDFNEKLQQARNGDQQAYDDLVAHYLKFVSRVSNKYAKLFRLNPDDLFSIGSIGLLKAIEKFDETRGFAFLTYAAVCIENEIKVALRDNYKELGNNVFSYDSFPNWSDDYDAITYLETISASDENVEERVIDVDTFRFCDEYLKKVLSEKKYKICDLYFGFSGKQMKSMNEIAKYMGCTRANCQRVISDAKAMLKKRFKRVEELDGVTLL